MPIISSTTSNGTPVGPPMTLDALMLRAKEVAERRNQINKPREMISPWQGFAALGETIANKMEQGRADRDLATSREGFAKLMAGIDPVLGATPQQQQEAFQYGPEYGMELIKGAAAARQADLEYKRDLALRESDYRRDIARKDTEYSRDVGRSDFEWDREQKDQAADEARKAAADQAAADVKRKADLEVSLQEYEAKKAIDAKSATSLGGDLDAVQKLRKEYTASPQYKRFDEVKAGYDRMQGGAKANTGAGDIAMVYGYMKMLDPGSVVREGEFATAEQVGGAAQRLLGIYNKLVNGDRLTPAQRDEFMNAAGAQYGAVADELDRYNQAFAPNAMQFNVDPKFVVSPVPRYDPWKPTAPPEAAATEAGGYTEPGATAPAPQASPAAPESKYVVGQTYEFEDGTATFNGGDPKLKQNWTIKQAAP